MIKQIILYSIFFTILAINLIAQDEKDSTQIEMIPLEKFLENVSVDTTKYVMTKSPVSAVLLSLLMPGLGQLYVESYWKIPLFLGATGVLTYLIVDNHKKFIKFEDEWERMSDYDQNKNLWYLKKEFYRDNRDRSAFYLLGVYIINAIDAYVGAHLYDFNVDDNIQVYLNYYNGFKFSLNYHW